MTEHDTSDQSNYTTNELVRAAADAGASGDFVAVVATDADGRHQARNTVRRALERGRDVADAARMGGHFMAALWDGRTADAAARADAANAALLADAGVTA